MVTALAVHLCSGLAYAQSSSLSLQTAIDRALAQSPELAASTYRLEAQDHLIMDAERRPNPTLNAEVDNLAGTGDYWLPNQGEVAVGLSMPWERGGDRQARRALATRERDVMLAHDQMLVADLITEVSQAYLAIQVAQAELAVAEERLFMLSQLEALILRRVRAAQAPTAQVERVQARLLQARLAVTLARQTAVTARTHLASYWQGEGAFTVSMDRFFDYDPENLAGDLETNSSLFLDYGPERVEWDGRDNPELSLIRAQHSAAESRIDLESAKAVRDLTLGVELRTYEGLDDASVGLRLSMPLQVFNTNQDRVASQRAQARAVAEDLNVQRRRLSRTLEILTAQRTAQFAELVALDEAIIPRLEAALELSREGYERGAFSFLDMFDAHSSLIDARLRHVDALNALHQTDISIQRLTGAQPQAYRAAEGTPQ